MKSILLFAILLIWKVSYAQELNRQTQTLQENLIVINRLLEVDSLNASLFFERGILNYELENFGDALDDYNTSIKINPKNPAYYFHRGILYYTFQKADMAIMDADMALKHTETDDSLKYKILTNRGNAKAMKRDFSGAYQDYLTVLNYDSNDIAVLTNLGAVLDDLGETEEAIEYLKRVIELEPYFTGGYTNLAFRYMSLGNYPKALELNNKVLELQPNQPLGLNNRGYVKYKLGDLKGAQIDVNKSIELYPENSYAYKNRALIFIEMKEYKKACNDLDQAIKLNFTKMYGDEVIHLESKYCENN